MKAFIIEPLNSIDYKNMYRKNISKHLELYFNLIQENNLHTIVTNNNNELKINTVDKNLISSYIELYMGYDSWGLIKSITSCRSVYCGHDDIIYICLMCDDDISYFAKTDWILFTEASTQLLQSDFFDGFPKTLN